MVAVSTWRTLPERLDVELLETERLGCAMQTRVVNCGEYSVSGAHRSDITLSAWIICSSAL